MNKKILLLAIPNIISNISNPLVSAVDTALMGHLSILDLAALGAIGMVFMVIYGTFNFLRSGTTGIAAQAYGAKQNQLISNTLYRAIFIALLLGVLFIFLRGYIFDISKYLMNIDSSYSSRAEEYFNIRIYTAPAVYVSYVLMGWFFALQNAIYPLIMTIVLNILNIILSYYFVYILKMGIEGAALGTLISQYLSLLLGFILLLKYKKYFIKLNFKQIAIKDELLRFFRVNSDIFIRTLALTFAFAFLYSQAALAGKDELAVVILLLQFVIWFAYSLDGFANASESLVGKYYGARDWNSFNNAIKLSIIWSFFLSVAYMIFYYIASEEILKLFTSNTELISKTLSYMPYIIMVPLLSFLAFIWDGIYIGMTATKAMRNTVLVSLIFYIVGFYLTRDIETILALWINFILFLFYRGLIQTTLFYKYKSKLC